MYLGIEIGGTKLQLGVGAGDGSPLVAIERTTGDPESGAAGILDFVSRAGTALLAQHPIQAVGIGFGGPVDANRGQVVKSHHIQGWSDFPLVEWCAERLARPTIMANDADTAGLAEACFGAGRDANPVLYITVGTGIGGGLIVDRKIYRGAGAGAAEIGHLRPGLQSDQPEMNLESLAAGWGIAAAAQARLADPMSYRLGKLTRGTRPRSADAVRQRLIEAEEADEESAGDLLDRCDGRPEALTAKMVGEAAAARNQIALEVLHQAWQALGWGIAQAITLVAPQVVVIGGGVSLLGPRLFFEPLAREVKRYVFPPFLGKYRIVPAALGEEVVLHGALALAAQISPT